MIDDVRFAALIRIEHSAQLLTVTFAHVQTQQEIASQPMDLGISFELCVDFVYRFRMC